MPIFEETILLTGATTGLGYWAAYELAQRHPNARIVIASRSNKDKADYELNMLLQTQQKSSSHEVEAQVEFLPLDLVSTANIRSFVNDYASKSYPPISVLYLNAGIQLHQGKDVRLSPDGIETTFAVNHVGHALLLFLLKPLLAPNARIVITASGTHDPAQKTMVPDAIYQTAELLAHPTDSEGYETHNKGLQRYSSSKLANVLFTYALERRLMVSRKTKEGKGWTVVVMDPGLMPGTGLGREFGPVVLWVFTHVMTRLLWLMKLMIWNSNVHLPQDSGKNLASLGTLEGARERSGKYFEGAKVVESSVDSHDEAKQDDLWRWTVDFLAKDEEEQKAFETF